jgi:hypothetical protein
MAINDVQIWILTAFSLVPTNDFIRKCCFDVLKKHFNVPSHLVKLSNGSG